jgi:hypothetical protein
MTRVRRCLLASDTPRLLRPGSRARDGCGPKLPASCIRKAVRPDPPPVHGSQSNGWAHPADKDRWGVINAEKLLADAVA